MQKLLVLPLGDRPKAVVTVNDPCAIGVMEAIKEAGLTISDNMAIAGFIDDIRAALLNPPLSTIHLSW